MIALSFQAAAMESGAEFSPCRTWRYALWRRWREGPVVAFIGLNPSTADETRNDPTVQRCVGFAKRWRYSGLLMLNAYAFRTTDPAVMKAAPDPVGPQHEERLIAWRERATAFVAAWGLHCDPARAAQICELLGRPIACLGRTRDGAPKHPLYLKATTRRRQYWAPYHPASRAASRKIAPLGAPR